MNMSGDYEYLADAIQLARNQAGYSQPELAAELGIGVDKLRRWEQNRTRCPVDMLCRIGKECGGSFVLGADGPMWEPDPADSEDNEQ